MKNFTTIKAEDFSENSIKLIGSDWMLITAGSISSDEYIQDKSFNTMTASWGGMGFLWNKPAAFIFVRPQRFTFNFTEKEDVFTLSFFSSDYRGALSLCGKVSGKDVNKVKEAGLTPITVENGSVAFQEASIILECKKNYADFLKPDCFIDKSIISSVYSAGDFHKMYIGEITKVWKKNT
ncbi:MAG TPA: flavin reductase [Treponemataceae bacterium]|jgi:flavin reductase (DIM6/NTAB) family NADH-FMN oxidoreductase RutF|nr:flavin reductase [Treponemataceae bacterium]